jgi:hypothetical protein
MTEEQECRVATGIAKTAIRADSSRTTAIKILAMALYVVLKSNPEQLSAECLMDVETLFHIACHDAEGSLGNALSSFGERNRGR